MKISLLTLLLLVSESLFAGEILVAGGYFLSYANILGQNEIPSYKGNGIFSEVEFLHPLSSSRAIGFFGVFHTSNSSNTVNDETSEKLKAKYLGGGLKYYLQRNLFFSASIGRLTFNDQVTGSIVKDIKSEESAMEVGIGYRLKLSRLTGMTISANALHASLNPENGSGFYQDYDLWQYRINIGLSFIIPSGPIK